MLVFNLAHDHDWVMPHWPQRIAYLIGYNVVVYFIGLFIVKVFNLLAIAMYIWIF